MTSHEPPARDPRIGAVFAERYRIERRLGAGGMGVVYAATQLAMDRLVALKVLTPELCSSEQARARFVREMRAASRVEHAHTVRVYDFGEEPDGQLFLAMELLAGRTLHDELRQRGALSLHRVIRIGAAIGKALAAAHAVGVVHRDLKPENIMLLDRHGEQDDVRVLDFGIARLLDDEGSDAVTRTGSLLGTPLYMSPEAALGQRVDARADLYALGLILYQMSTGQLAFHDAQPLRVLYMHAHVPAPSAAATAPGRVPGALDALIAALLAKDPGRRPGSADDVVRALQDLSESATVDGIAPQGASRLADDPTAMAAARALWADPQRAVGTVRDAIVAHGGIDVTAQTMDSSEDARLTGGDTEALGGPPADVAVGAASRGHASDDAAGMAPTLAGDLRAPTPSLAGGSPARRDADIVATGDAVAVVAASTTPPARNRRLGAALVVVVGAVGIAFAVLTRSSGPIYRNAETIQPDGLSSDTSATTEHVPDRTALHAALAAAGLPAAATACQAQDAAELRAMATAVGSLAGAKPASKRDQDRAAMQQLAPLTSGEAMAVHAWAMLAAGRGDVEVAHRVHNAISACPQLPLAHRTMATIHARAERWPQAREAIARALADAPNDAAAWRLRGLIALAERDPAAAQAAYVRAVALEPGDVDGSIGLGRARLAGGDARGAAMALDDALRRAPQRHDARVQRGAAAAALGDAEGAKVAFCAAAAAGYRPAATLCAKAQAAPAAAPAP